MKLVEPPSCSSPSAIVLSAGTGAANGSPRNRTVSMAACSSTARKPSNTRCSKTAIIPKPSSNWRAKSNSTWAAGVRLLRRHAPRDASRSESNGHPLQGEQDGSASFRFKPGTGRRYHDRPHAPDQPASRHHCRQRQHGTLSCAATARLPSGSHRRNLPHSERAALGRPDRGPQFPSGDRGRSRRNIAVPRHQRRHRCPDRLPGKRLPG